MNNKMTKKRALKIAKEVLKEDMQECEHAIERFEECLEYIDTFNEFMELKAHYIKALLTEFPLGSSQCPYCILHRPKCEECEWGTQRGICGEDESLYSDICNTKTTLLRLLDKYGKPLEKRGD
jgi:hypothetical protein